jgi:hypothetical protein
MKKIRKEKKKKTKELLEKEQDVMEIYGHQREERI